jgi:type I restriction enzyme, S subunit
MTADAEGSAIVPLSSVLTDVQPGFASGKFTRDGVGIAHFRPMNVSTEGMIERAVTKFVAPELARGRADRLLKRNDILFNNTNSPELVGKTALFTGDETPAFSNHMTRLRVDEARVLPEYVARYLHACWMNGTFQGLANNHVSQASIGRKVLGDLPLPLPALSIQRQVVQTLQEVDVAITQSRQRLTRASDLIVNLRRAVLRSAVAGELSSEWRTARSLADWQLAKASDLCIKVQSGGTPKTGWQSEPGVPFLKVYNIVNQAVDFAYKPQYVSEEVHQKTLKKSVAHPGDVIMNIVGPPLGKVAIVPDVFAEWNLNQAITIFRPGPRVLGEWLYIFLRAGLFLEDEELVTRGSAGQSNISLTQCRNLQIPVPPLDEQQHIIRIVKRMLQAADEACTRVADAELTLKSVKRVATCQKLLPTSHLEDLA